MRRTCHLLLRKGPWIPILVILAVATPTARGQSPQPPIAAEDASVDAEVAQVLGADVQTQVPTRTTTDEPRTIHPPSWLVDPLALLWRVGILLVAVFLLWLLVSILLPRGMDDDADGEVRSPADADPAWADDGLRRADALAARGLFAAALHLLLLAALTQLKRRGGLTIADSLTSREILRRVPVPDGAREPLAALVGGVELSLFGGRACHADAYRSGRRDFERVSAQLAGGVS